MAAATKDRIVVSERRAVPPPGLQTARGSNRSSPPPARRSARSTTARAAGSSSVRRSSAPPARSTLQLFVTSRRRRARRGRARSRSFFDGATETLRETDYADACPIATLALARTRRWRRWTTSQLAVLRGVLGGSGAGSVALLRCGVGRCRLIPSLGSFPDGGGHPAGAARALRAAWAKRYGHGGRSEDTSDAEVAIYRLGRLGLGGAPRAVGPPLKRTAVVCERMRKLVALPVLSADAISSVAYGPEASSDPRARLAAPG